MRLAARDQWSFARRAPLVLLLVGVSSLLSGCESDPTVTSAPVLHGETMGTTYTVRLTTLPAGRSLDEIQTAVDATLERVNALMSNWRDDSEVSRFNRSDSTEWFEVSPETVRVLELSQTTSRDSGGAFDVTVGPLVELWGFGASGRRTTPPGDEQIAALADWVGWEKLEVRLDPPALRKRHPRLTVDLSAVAKGYGVDAVGETLEALGVAAYLVEIGGEVRVRGTKPDGSGWRVGIEAPRSGIRELEGVVALSDICLATSGDYRNYFEENGVRYSHTLDPTTKRPIAHSLASVTILAPTTAEADAWATALMVMGPDAGYNYAEDHHLPVLLIIRDGEGFVERPSPAWMTRFGELK